MDSCSGALRAGGDGFLLRDRSRDPWAFQRVEPPQVVGTAPAPWLSFFLGLVGGFGCHGILVFPSHAGLSSVRGPLVAIPMLVDAAVVAFDLGRRVALEQAAGWNDLYLLALGGGALLGHSSIWVITQRARELSHFTRRPRTASCPQVQAKVRAETVVGVP